MVGFVSLALLSPLLSKNALILYDGQRQKSEAYISARYISNLLGHFKLDNTSIISMPDYERGTEGRYDYVFIVSEEITPLPSPALVKDLRKRKNDIIWINLHIDDLLKASGPGLGIAFDRLMKGSDWKVSFKGQDYAKEDKSLNVIRIKYPKSVKVYAWAKDAQGRSFPYFLRSKNLWYVADSPFSYFQEGSAFLVLADLLHDILKENHPQSHKALIRIEDVNPESRPESLIKIADYLHGEKAPFQVSLIPIYKDPDNQKEVYLVNNPDLLKALKYAVSKGAAIVMHGVTHQYRGVSGDDYEFWDSISGKPIIHESRTWLSNRIKMGIAECFRNGLYPLAWETPHYSASQNDYKTIRKNFDTFYDQVMVAEVDGTQQPFPYPARLKDLDVKIIPENLGYVPIERPDTTLIIQAARKMLNVRDGMASFYFHPFVPIDYLKRIVKSMKAMGWEFVSIKDFPCNVITDSQWVTSSGGQEKITLLNQYLHEVLFDHTGRIQKETYSKERLSTVISKKVNVPKGSVCVVETLDILPAKKTTNIFNSVWLWIVERFKKKEKTTLKIPKTLVIHSKTSTFDEENDQQSFASVLKIFGFNPDIQQLMSQRKFSVEGFDVLVVPFAAAKELMDIEINSILGFAEKGGTVIIDGKSRLAEKLGIHFENKTFKVKELKELSQPARNIFWNPPASLNVFHADEEIPLCWDVSTEHPLAIMKPFGQGKVLFFGTLFDPYTNFGVSRYPYIHYYLRNVLQLSFIIRRNNLEFYFDPGLRQNTSWEELVKRWKMSGVKIVYLAAWHFYRAYQFNYKYFIDLCHGYGIGVYAWFEFPQVTPLFWDKNPQWREKTASLTDAKVGWRLQMNLMNPEAREEARKFFWKTLTDYDWDGLNLAELNFDTNNGTQHSETFVPMNSDVRNEFRKREKVDPLQIFEPASKVFWKRNPRTFEKFLKYRTDIIKNLHVFFLEEFEKIKEAKKKDMEVIVTVMDSIDHPEIIEECGIDVRDIIPLLDRFPLTLQVEDPARSWTDPPSRYAKYFESYKGLVKDPSRMMFDINIVDRKNISSTHLPSSQPVGMEIAATYYYATLPSGRAGIYSEATVPPYDADTLPFIMGSETQITAKKEEYVIDSRKPFTLMAADEDSIPLLDGKPWPFYGSRGISLPSGRHSLSFKKRELLDFSALAENIIFDSDIYDLTISGNIFGLRYNSPTPVSLTFSRPPERVSVDSEELPLSSQKTSLILPKGKHSLEIYTESQPAHTIDIVGYLSSNIFVILGLLSVSLLLGIYIYTRVNR